MTPHVVSYITLAKAPAAGAVQDAVRGSVVTANAPASWTEVACHRFREPISDLYGNSKFTRKITLTCLALLLDA